jgi:hypothetical protein
MTDEDVAAAFKGSGAENEPVLANQPISLEKPKAVGTDGVGVAPSSV